MLHPALGGKSPIKYITGRVPNISKYCLFRWFEIVNFYMKDVKLPGLRQRATYWLGPNNICGDNLTYDLCDCKTHEILTRSIVLKCNDPHFYNLRVPAPASPVPKEGEPHLYTVPGLGGEIHMPSMLAKISRVDGDGSSGPGEDEEDAPNGSDWQGYGELDEVDLNVRMSTTMKMICRSWRNEKQMMTRMTVATMNLANMMMMMSQRALSLK